MPPILMLVVLGAVLLNTAAQLVLKAGMNRIGVFDLTWSTFFPVLGQVAVNPWILLGVVFYVVSMIFWLFLLSRVEVSQAYPLMSLGFVLNAVAAYYIFGDSLSVLRLTGIGLIIVGVFLVARS
ncbi:MAG: SMR family transporter [Gammaproteobacteria bacterium]